MKGMSTAKIYELYTRDARCVKCGSSLINCQFHPIGGIQCPANYSREHHACDRMDAGSDIPMNPIRPEHMLRTCSNCSFQWIELPLDAINKDSIVTRRSSKFELYTEPPAPPKSDPEVKCY